jgi:hypothetical protein
MISGESSDVDLMSESMYAERFDWKPFFWTISSASGLIQMDLVLAAAGVLLGAAHQINPSISG